MPAKLIPVSSFLSFSSALNRHIHEFNNVSAAVLEISNRHHFVDFLYVFENRPINLRLVSHRLEFMHDIFEIAELNRTKVNNDRFEIKNSPKADNTSKPSISNNCTVEKNYSMNEMNQEENENKIFSPAFINHNLYKPAYGFHEAKCLYNGMRFIGEQEATYNSYDVEVVIQNVDFENLYICGHFNMNGLTEEYPTLTTFFDGEIISSRYPFFTRKFDTNLQVDKSHWQRLIPAKQFAHVFDDDSPIICMRWKERYLVKDHKIKEVSGCSFAGFYYIIFSKLSRTIDGFYYHKQSELLQRLSLKHDPDPTTKIYEFR